MGEAVVMVMETAVITKGSDGDQSSDGCGYDKIMVIAGLVMKWVMSTDVWKCNKNINF